MNITYYCRASTLGIDYTQCVGPEKVNVNEIHKEVEASLQQVLIDLQNSGSRYCISQSIAFQTKEEISKTWEITFLGTGSALPSKYRNGKQHNI